MSKFIKFLGRAHINSMNVALYESGTVRAENVVTNRSIGAMSFDSVEAAEDWFDGLSQTDDNTTKTVLAIDALRPQREGE